VCARRPNVAEIGILGEKTKKKICGWVGNSISIGGRVTKIDAFLSSIVVYQMSMRLLHKTNIEEIYKPIRSFLISGLGVLTKGNTILLNGNGCVNPREKVV
jgi:hypothetical protein